MRLLNLRNLPFVPSGAIALHFLGMLTLRSIMNHVEIASTNTLLENLWLVIFLAPELIWSRPWAGVLGRLGLMEGEWWRMPSLPGLALVNFIYVLGLVGFGFLLRRRGS